MNIKLIESNAVFAPQTDFTVDGIWKHIERCGRICYKSEDRIMKDSHIRFVDMIVKRGHLAVLEHGTVYLKIPVNGMNEGMYISYFKENPYSRVVLSDGENYFDDLGFETDNTDIDAIHAYVTTNYRVIIENGYTYAMRWICNPTEHHQKRITAMILCDRGVSHELVRHRVFSFAQESTRYCNYSSDKFGKHITFIRPTWTDRGRQDVFNMAGIDFVSEEKALIEYLRVCEATYHLLIKAGQTPQEARAVLPNCTKTEVAMTGFTDQWEAFFKLRSAPTAHPDMQKVSKQLETEYNIMKKGKITGDIELSAETEQLLEEQVNIVNGDEQINKE